MIITFELIIRFKFFFILQPTTGRKFNHIKFIRQKNFFLNENSKLKKKIANY